MVSSNLNSKLFRFHCVTPKLDTHKLIFILCGENSPNFTCHTTLRVHNINNQSTVPPLRSSLLVCIRKFTWEVKWFEFELKNPIDLIQEVLASSGDILYSLYVHKGPLSSPSIQTYSSVPNRRLSLISVHQRKKSPKINSIQGNFSNKHDSSHKLTESSIRDIRVARTKYQNMFGE